MNKYKRHVQGLKTAGKEEGLFACVREGKSVERPELATSHRLPRAVSEGLVQPVASIPAPGGSTQAWPFRHKERAQGPSEKETPGRKCGQQEGDVARHYQEVGGHAEKSEEGHHSHQI